MSRTCKSQRRRPPLALALQLRLDVVFEGGINALVIRRNTQLEKTQRAVRAKVVCFNATTLWHFDAAEWAPSTASFASVGRVPTTSALAL
jgi:hypothetical protein